MIQIQWWWRRRQIILFRLFYIDWQKLNGAKWMQTTEMLNILMGFRILLIIIVRSVFYRTMLLALSILNSESFTYWTIIYFRNLLFTRFDFSLNCLHLMAGSRNICININIKPQKMRWIHIWDCTLYVTHFTYHN